MLFKYLFAVNSYLLHYSCDSEFNFSILFPYNLCWNDSVWINQLDLFWFVAMEKPTDEISVHNAELDISFFGMAITALLKTLSEGKTPALHEQLEDNVKGTPAEGTTKTLFEGRYQKSSNLNSVTSVCEEPFLSKFYKHRHILCCDHYQANLTDISFLLLKAWSLMWKTARMCIHLLTSFLKEATYTKYNSVPFLAICVDVTWYI